MIYLGSSIVLEIKQESTFWEGLPFLFEIKHAKTVKVKKKKKDV